MIDIKISNQPLSISNAEWVISPDCGGVDIFVGTVREQTQGRKVLRLEFESYESMAVKEMQKIAEYIKEKYSARKVLIHHRTGVLQVNDIAVLIAVSTAHRDAAFLACRYAIDTLKETVPIWKKEIFEDGEVWVSAHP